MRPVYRRGARLRVAARCLRVKRMADVDAKVLEKLVANAVAYVKQKHA